MPDLITSGMQPKNPAYQESIAKILMQQGASTAPVYGWGQGLARILAGVVGGVQAEKAQKQRDKYDTWKDSKKMADTLKLYQAQQDIKNSAPSDLERDLRFRLGSGDNPPPPAAPAAPEIAPPTPTLMPPPQPARPSPVLPQPAANMLPQKPASNMFLDKILGGFKPNMITPPAVSGDAIQMGADGKPSFNMGAIDMPPDLNQMPPAAPVTAPVAQNPEQDLREQLFNQKYKIKNGMEALSKEGQKRYYTLQDEIDGAQEVSRQNQIAQSLIPDAILGAQAGNLNSLNKMAIQLGFGGDEDIKAASSTDQLVKILSERVVGRAKELGYNPSNADVAFIQNASGSIETLAPALQRILKINDEANKFKIGFNSAQQEYMLQNRGSLSGFKYDQPIPKDILGGDVGTGFTAEKQSRLDELLKRGGYTQ